MENTPAIPEPSIEKKLLVEVLGELKTLSSELKTVKTNNEKIISDLKTENEALKTQVEKAEYRIQHLSKHLREYMDAEKK